MISKLSNKFNSETRWLLMWVIVFLGYIFFILNWMLIPNLAGTVANHEKGIAATGWQGDFFTLETKPTNLQTQALNYSLTLMRGIGALAVGYLISKITHKWTTVISLFFLLAAIPSVWIGNYTGFVFFRLFLALGGSTLVVLLQPIKTKLLPPHKSFVAILVTLGFSIGGILSLFPFVLSQEISNCLIENWKMVATISASLSILLLVSYLIVGQNFAPKKRNKYVYEEQTRIEYRIPWKVKDLLKELNVWIWIIFFGAFLVVLVMPTILYKDIFVSKSDSFNHLREVKIWVIFVFIGVFLAPFTISKWLKTDYKRKPFIIFILFLGLISFILSYIFWINHWDIPFLIAGFFFGWFIQSIQGVILYLAHEDLDKISSRRISSFYGIIWGFGYWFFTIINIVVAIAIDQTNNPDGIWAFSIIAIICFICVVFGFFIKETKPFGKWFSFKKHKK